MTKISKRKCKEHTGYYCPTLNSCHQGCYNEASQVKSLVPVENAPDNKVVVAEPKDLPDKDLLLICQESFKGISYHLDELFNRFDTYRRVHSLFTTLNRGGMPGPQPSYPKGSTEGESPEDMDVCKVFMKQLEKFEPDPDKTKSDTPGDMSDFEKAIDQASEKSPESCEAYPNCDCSGNCLETRKYGYPHKRIEGEGDE